MAKTQGGGGPSITIPLDRLPQILDRLVTDRELRARLERDPVDALGAFGVELDAATRERFAGRSLAELVAEELGMDPRALQRLGPTPLPLVVVGARTLTRTRSQSAVVSGVTSVGRTATSVLTATAVNTVVAREPEQPARPARPRRRPTARPRKGGRGRGR
jgi:hypothetical protein